jgi:hypothetical protein
MVELNPGDHFPVKIGDRTFDTVIDEQGVQRFVHSTIIESILDHSGAAFNEWLKTDRTSPEPWSLNVLAEEYSLGKHSLDEMLTFYTSTHYSVGGFADLSYFSGLDIRNPVWEADHYTRLSSEALTEFMGLINEQYLSNSDRAVNYVTQAVFSGKWKTDDGDVVAAKDTINRVLEKFLWDTQERYLFEVKPVETTSDELKGFLESVR